MYIPDQTEARHIFELIFHHEPEMPCNNPDALGLYVKLSMSRDEFQLFQSFVSKNVNDATFIKQTRTLSHEDPDEHKILLAACKLADSHSVVIAYLFGSTHPETIDLLKTH